MKRISALLMVLLFGVASTAFAGGATQLRDSDLDNVNAGDWIVVSDGSEVVDVYGTNNTLDLEDEAQMEVQAISNANTVDAASAVQANVAHVNGEEPASNVNVSGLNQATIANYRPGMSTKVVEKAAMEMSSKSVLATSLTDEESCNMDYSKSFAEQMGGGSGSSKVFTLDETLDIVGAYASAGEAEGKSDDSEYATAASLLVDYDKDIDANESASCSFSAGSNGSETMTVAHGSKVVNTMDQTIESSFGCSKETQTETRNAMGANNHINLKDTAQTNIQAISNLNAVASGVAVQTNVASNVGVNGSISGTNIANVSSGAIY